MSTTDKSIVYRSSMLLKGIGLVTFGLVALCYPGEAINALLMPFGVLVTINGAVVVFNHTRYFAGRSCRGQVLFRKGVAELLIGLAAISAVMMEAAVFEELVALWIILTGSMLTSNFYRLRDWLPQWPVMVVAGLFSVLFGLFMAINSVAEMLSLTYDVALFALLLGSSMFYAYARLGETRQYVGHRPKKIYSPYTVNA